MSPTSAVHGGGNGGWNREDLGYLFGFRKVRKLACMKRTKCGQRRAGSNGQARIHDDTNEARYPMGDSSAQYEQTSSEEDDESAESATGEWNRPMPVED